MIFIFEYAIDGHGFDDYFLFDNFNGSPYLALFLNAFTGFRSDKCSGYEKTCVWLLQIGRNAPS